ncbi:hypothetical protein [Bradyrhizobium phage BDU-MI-1]|nr:hypothetical protein [Bradyrhizobium phage BDU-MI-1]
MFGQCKLIWTSSTTLKLIPVNGNLITINGQVYQIPAAGITISNAGFAANTLYYIYAYDNAGTLTLTGNQAGHVTSTTPGNVGVEVMTGAGGDAYSLVGMAYSSSLSTFFYDRVTKWVRSWYNDSGISCSALSGTNVSTPNTAMTLLDTNCHVYTLLWAGEMYDASFYSWCNCNTDSAAMYYQGGVNGAVIGAYDVATANSTRYSSVTNGFSDAAGADGRFEFQQFGMTSGGTVSFYNKVTTVTTTRK